MSGRSLHAEGRRLAMADLTLAKAPAATGGRMGVRPKRWLRPALIAVGPLVLLLVGGYYYLSSGRFVSTDNAYVRADITMVSTDVSARVADVLVRENDSVTA